MNQDGTDNKQATAVELSALLVECVCVPGPGEGQAVAALASALAMRPEVIAEELLYLRAFAVDFAVLMSLGDAPAKDQILSRYYEHWDRIDREAEGTRDALEQRLRDYAGVVGDVEPGAGGLARRLGIALAAFCGNSNGSPPAEPASGDNQAAAELMVFAARLFAALYDEVTSMLTEVDIILLED